MISCRWDVGGDGHRRIMAKHRVSVELLLLGIFGVMPWGAARWLCHVLLLR